MGIEFEKKLDSVTGHRANRHKYADEVVDNPELFPELIRLCFLDSNKNAAKACWILELVCYEKLRIDSRIFGFFLFQYQKFNR